MSQQTVTYLSIQLRGKHKNSCVRTLLNQSLLVCVLLFFCCSMVKGQEIFSEVQSKQSRLRAITNTFYQRLETTFKYQEAVLPVGVMSIERFLQIGNKNYSLEYAVNDPLQKRQIRENYFLEIINRDTIKLHKAKYLISGGYERKGKKNSRNIFTNYINESLFEAERLFISQDFDPVALISTNVVEAKNGQSLYVTNDRYETIQNKTIRYEDTVACYRLQRSSMEETYQLEFWERRVQTTPRWHQNNTLSITWLVESSKRQVLATQNIITGGGEYGGQYNWVRTYQTNGDFTETLYHEYMSSHAVMSNDLLYRRNCKQLSKEKSIDTYSSPYSDTFTIVSYYR